MFVPAQHNVQRQDGGVRVSFLRASVSDPLPWRGTRGICEAEVKHPGWIFRYLNNMQKVKICLCQNTSLEVCESPGSLAPTLLVSPTPQYNLILHKLLRNKFDPADKREMSKKIFYGSSSFNLSPPKDPGSVVSTPVCVIWTSLKYHWLTLVTVPLVAKADIILVQSLSSAFHCPPNQPDSRHKKGAQLCQQHQKKRAKQKKKRCPHCHRDLL